MLILNSQRNKGQMCWLTLLSSERSCSLQCSHILSGGWQFLTETKPWFWFAPWIPLLLSLILPGRRLSEGWLRIPLTRGEPPLFHLWKGGAQMYRDAQECQNPLSNRLGTSHFSLKIYLPRLPVCLVFLHLFINCTFLKVSLKQFSNLCAFVMTSYKVFLVSSWRWMTIFTKVFNFLIRVGGGH